MSPDNKAKGSLDVLVMKAHSKKGAKLGSSNQFPDIVSAFYCRSNDRRQLA